MQIYNIKDMLGGWFIGDFSPTVLKTNLFEVSVKTYKKNEIHEAHFHKVAKEINLLFSGKLSVQNKILEAGDIFVFEPYEIADPIFMADCVIVCIKTPSVKNDKYIVTKDNI